MDFVHHVMFWKEHNILETGYVSILRWKDGEILLTWVP
jgi:hypothetical protein